MANQTRFSKDLRNKSVLKKIKILGRALKTPEATVDRSPPSAHQLKRWQRLSPRFARALDRACQTVGINPDDARALQFLFVILVLVIFGGRSPGAPKKWSKRQRRRLREDVAEMQKADPKLSELECCKIIKKRNGYDIGAETLRRLLHPAKRNEKNNQLPPASEINRVAQAISKKESFTL